MRFDEWSIAGFERGSAVELCHRGVNPLAAVFLCSRGVVDYEEVCEYFSDGLSEIHDPFLLDDMDKAVSRIQSALQNNEKIVIYGDYDVDGMTSSALVKSYLRKCGTDCEIYIPGRADEGYGLNRSALEYLKERNTDLIITVDCGITALEEAVYAKELGMDLVITDHHECRDELPDAVAVIDPKRPDSSYPNRHLAGVGVAFKLVCALDQSGSLGNMLSLYSDLVAIGTIADVMPVKGENRFLIRAGLQKLSRDPRPGLRALMKATGTTPGSVNTAAIGFTLSPRLNAAGRMGCTSLSIDILLTDDYKEAEGLTAQLSTLNCQRRELENEIFTQVEEQLSDKEPKGPVVMAGESWYHGVMGIVAARTAERWMMPSIMINIDDDGIGRGSCRSYGGFLLHTALQKCEDLLVNYGGHEMAAGITIERDNIPLLRQRMTEIYRAEVLTPPVSSLYIDFEVEKPRLLDLENVEALGRLEPFGNGFFPPHMMIRGAKVALISPVGGGKHTRLRLEKKGASLDCIFFGAEAGKLGVSKNSLVDVAFEPQVNEFRGRRNVQLHVIDLRPH